MFSCKNLIVAIIAIYLVTSVLKDDIHKLIVTGIAMYILIATTEGLENNNNNKATDNNKVKGDVIVSGNKVKAGGAKKDIPKKPSVVNMGPYDGLCLKTGNNEYWMKSPDETALVPNDGLYTYLASQGPLKTKLSDQSALNGPPIDGVKGSSEKMFMWANNITSPLCCPSTFSTSTGCVCSTKNQRDFISSRGYLAEDEVNGLEDLITTTSKKAVNGSVNGITQGGVPPAIANDAVANRGGNGSTPVGGGTPVGEGAGGSTPVGGGVGGSTPVGVGVVDSSTPVVGGN